jgi:hypothetical protein
MTFMEDTLARLVEIINHNLKQHNLHVELMYMYSNSTVLGYLHYTMPSGQLSSEELNLHPDMQFTQDGIAKSIVEARGRLYDRITRGVSL